MATSSQTKAVTFTAPCPPWCTLEPGHQADAHYCDGVVARSHAGPTFGQYFSAHADEFGHRQGLLEPAVSVSDDIEDCAPVDLLLLAFHAQRAAEWLEAHQ